MATDRAISLVALLGQAREGNEAARDELFRRCRNYVSVVAQAQVDSRIQAKVDASDLVQLTMLEAVRDCEAFRGQTDAQWLAWLRKLLSNNAGELVRNYHYTQKRAIGREADGRQGDTSAAVFDPPAETPTPSQVAMQHERELKLADSLAALPADYRQVVMLRNLQRLPFEEIADRMGRSRPAVQMLWMRALKQLQGQMEADAVDE